MDASDRRGQVVAEAAEWWVMLQSDLSPAQRQRYVDWLRESALHVAEMLRIAQVHGALSQFERWTRLPTQGTTTAELNSVVPLPLSPRYGLSSRDTWQQRNPFRLGTMRSMAAMLVVAALGVLLIVNFRGHVIQTERGERREVALADGTIIQVDPETSLRIDYSAHQRDVVLVRGRALFRVARAPDRPFQVQVHETTVRALGTAFAVDQEPHSIVVTVAEGKVAVTPARSLRTASALRSSESDSAQQNQTGQRASSGSPSGPESHSTTAAVSGTDAGAEILLVANEQVTVDSSGSAEPVREVNTDRALAWAAGTLIFQNDPLSYVVEQFNRYNHVQLHVNDVELARRPVSGVFKASDPESFVAFIQSVASVKVTRYGATQIIIDTKH